MHNHLNRLFIALGLLAACSLCSGAPETADFSNVRKQGFATVFGINHAKNQGNYNKQAGDGITFARPWAKPQSLTINGGSPNFGPVINKCTWAKNAGMYVMLCLDGHFKGTTADDSTTRGGGPITNIGLHKRYVRELVAAVDHLVDSYEYFNEPNLFYKGTSDQYLEGFIATHDAIREAGSNKPLIGPSHSHGGASMIDYLLGFESFRTRVGGLSFHYGEAPDTYRASLANYGMTQEAVPFIRSEWGDYENVAGHWDDVARTYLRSIREGYLGSAYHSTHSWNPAYGHQVELLSKRLGLGEGDFLLVEDAGKSTTVAAVNSAGNPVAAYFYKGRKTFEWSGLGEVTEVTVERYRSNQSGVTQLGTETVPVVNGVMTSNFGGDFLSEGLYGYVITGADIPDPDPNPPVFDMLPSVQPNPVAGTSATVTATASDPDGEAITYVWSYTGPAPVEFSAELPTATATFTQAGDYTITCTVTSTSRGSVSAGTPCTVQQIATGVSINPN